MKFAVDLDKGILGNPDSKVMWANVVSHIPDSELLKPNFRILIVACGHGTEAVILAQRMFSLGISKQEVQKSIYLIDKYQVFTNYVKTVYGFVNVITEDFLTWETDMKFDTVLGNPPYSSGNQGLWQEFAKKGISLVKDDGYFGFVTPNAWANGSHLNTEKNIFNSIFQKYQTLAINPNVNEHFAGIGKKISYWIIKKTSSNKTNKTTIVYQDKKLKVDIKKYPFFINEFSDIGLGIFEKVLAKNEFWNEFREAKSEFCRELAFPKTRYNAKYRFGFKYDKINQDFPTSSVVLALDCTSYTLDEVKNIYSQFNSKMFRFLWRIYGANDAGSFGWILRSMPKLLVTSKEWSDKRIYKNFDLTNKEIAFIEQTTNDAGSDE